MYDKIWEKGEISKTWKRVIITPQLKEGKEPKHVKSYRPVALTNIIVWYLEKEKKIDDGQFGFRKQKQMQ